MYKRQVTTKVNELFDGKIDMSDFPNDTSLSLIHIFFQVKNYADEYFKALDKDFKGNILEQDTDETVAQTADEIIEATRDFIRCV